MAAPSSTPSVTPSATPSANKPLEISLWVIAGVLTGVYMVTGAAMFAGRLDATFRAWGYPEGVPAMVGILVMLGALGLLFVRTAGWSALGLMVLTLAAIFVLGAHQAWLAALAPLAALAVLAFVVWGRGLTWTTRDVAELPS